MSRPPRLPSSQRLALRLLHAGTAYRLAEGHWRVRRFPEQAIANETMRSLIRSGLARSESYAGAIDPAERRELAQITVAGKQAYAGVGAPAPIPLPAERVLVEIEEALPALAERSAELNRALARAEAELAHCRAGRAELDDNVRRIEAHLAELAQAGRSLEARRADLRRVVAQIADQLSPAIPSPKA